MLNDLGECNGERELTNHAREAPRAEESITARHFEGRAHGHDVAVEASGREFLRAKPRFTCRAPRGGVAIQVGLGLVQILDVVEVELHLRQHAQTLRHGALCIPITHRHVIHSFNRPIQGQKT